MKQRDDVQENINASSTVSPSVDAELPHKEATSQDMKCSEQPQIPHLPFPRMSIAHRAKIFMPFDALKGYQAALRKAEEEIERLHEGDSN